MLLADSLVNGFVGSNLMGQAIVAVQLLGSVVMFAVIIGKYKELRFVARLTRRFLRDFASAGDVIEYYLNHRPSSAATGVVAIYAHTCER